ncbi:hypothetical protein [Brucella sp. JSBI001]|uniref:hypothetical protein n=1 Tax=Brucella sp. JSBI001 TaxID=2886044 RepID=UPI00222F8EF9|nr:hypothetical protein [Brucella sp. JSBI001]UZD70794.1 hypothetical protein LJ361_05070 [Brucella sp. JSBI001]
MGEAIAKVFLDTLDYIWRYQFSNIVSVASLAMAATSLTLSWRHQKWIRANTEPEVQVELSEAPVTGDWYKLTIRIRNNRGYVLRGTEIRIKSPRGVKIVPYRDHTTLNPETGEIMITGVEIDKYSNRAPLHIYCDKAGTEKSEQRVPMAKGNGDTDQEDFLLSFHSNSHLYTFSYSGHFSKSNSPRRARSYNSSCKRLKCFISLAFSRMDMEAFQTIAVTATQADK